MGNAAHCQGSSSHPWCGGWSSPGLPFGNRPLVCAPMSSTRCVRSFLSAMRACDSCAFADASPPQHTYAQPLFSDDEFQRLRDLFLEKHSNEELHARYKELMVEILGARGHSIEVCGWCVSVHLSQQRCEPRALHVCSMLQRAQSCSHHKQALTAWGCRLLTSAAAANLCCSGAGVLGAAAAHASRNAQPTLAAAAVGQGEARALPLCAGV